MGETTQKHTITALIVGLAGVLSVGAPFVVELSSDLSIASIGGGLLLIVVALVLASDSSPSGHERLTRRGG